MIALPSLIDIHHSDAGWTGVLFINDNLALLPGRAHMCHLGLSQTEGKLRDIDTVTMDVTSIGDYIEEFVILVDQDLVEVLEILLPLAVVCLEGCLLLVDLLLHLFRGHGRGAAPLAQVHLEAGLGRGALGHLVDGEPTQRLLVVVGADRVSLAWIEHVAEIRDECRRFAPDRAHRVGLWLGPSWGLSR